MNHEETRFAAKVMAAWAEGKTVQAKDKHAANLWFDCASGDEDSMSWNWSEMEYRIKPEPRVFYFAEFSDGSLTSKPLTREEVRDMKMSRVVRSTTLVKFVEVLP